MRYYKVIEHANTTDKEEEVIEITSTEEEKRKINIVKISKETNAGYLKFYIDREQTGEHLTAQLSIQNFIEFGFGRELALGEIFKITLQNKAIGTNAEIFGLIEYEIL